MEIIHQLFYRNLDVVFFVYGFAFVTMGVTVLVQPKKGSEFKIANILWLLAAFGIVHGLNELLDMWAIIRSRQHVLDIARWFMLVISYFFLFEFGRRLFRLSIPKAPVWQKKIAALLAWWLLPLIGSIIFIGSFASHDFWKVGSILTRYLLGLPGGFLIGFGFYLYYRHEEAILKNLKVKKYFLLGGVPFLIYGMLGGLVVPKGDFFPANWLNTDSFLLTVKIPVQVFRAVCAILATWAISGMLKIFNWEIRNKLQEAQIILKQQLKESEERYMEIVEGSSDIIHTIDTDGCLICTNKQGCGLLGFSQSEIMGLHIKEICGEATWKQIEKGFGKLEREGSVFIDSGQLLKKSGEVLNVAIHSQAMYDDKKNLYGARLTIRDITERRKAEEALRESEERYRVLFEESRDAIYITSRDGAFIDINKSALELFGYTKAEIISLSTSEIYANPQDRNRFQNAIETIGFVRDFPMKFRRKGGTERDCLITSTIRRDNNGRIIGYQGIIRDVTDVKKKEEELMKIEKLESVGILAGGIAHDFNNILTNIVGNISLAKMLVNSDMNLTEILSAAEKACQHAKDLTKQLLTFSKGGAPIKKITAITELLKDSAGFSSRGSNIKCDFSIPDDLWPVEIDEGQISQVINNLVINANQAMPKGGTIHVQAENIVVGVNSTLPLPNGDYIKISVKDEGVGIPEEDLPKIFDPYFTTKQQGSGLGLTTTYSIINNHDGYISVESEVYAGTTFHIYLPAVREKLVETNKESDKIIRGEGKILLMEDEASIRQTVSKVLKQIGYTVETAKNGEETIKQYTDAMGSELPFDIVMMDLTIRGGMGGKETIQELLRIDPEVKAIVSSGYSNDPIMADFKKYGFSGVITKPYEIEELSDLLNNVTKKTTSRMN
ncbi:MAG: PAS domain S-box protein [Nitrospirae bacterium]|nr:PAS domain S-box protein [Nitrospirota bacterium]